MNSLPFFLVSTHGTSYIYRTILDLSFLVLNEKPDVNDIIIFLHRASVFFVPNISRFSFFLCVSEVASLVFLVFGVCWAFWICKLMLSVNVEMFSQIISSNFFNPLPLPRLLLGLQLHEFGPLDGPTGLQSMGFWGFCLSVFPVLFLFSLSLTAFYLCIFQVHWSFLLSYPELEST